MVGLTLQAVATGRQTAVLTAFLIAATTIVCLLMLLALFIRRVKSKQLQTLRTSPRAIKRFTGVVLVVVGGWLLGTAVFSENLAKWLF